MWPYLIILAGCPTHRYPDGSGLEGQLEREVIALKQKVRMLEADLATCGAEDVEGSVYAELFQVFSGSEIEIAQQGAATVITVRVSHLFSDVYAHALREESDQNMDLLATALLLHPDYDVTVVGHTSDAAIPLQFEAELKDHLELSLVMARTVADHLAKNYDVEDGRFTISGRGSRAPVASNDLNSGQDANQRLELFLQPPLPSGP